MTRPIGIDLFAGAGGLSLGFEQAGFDIAAAVEIDPIHCATHEFNFPTSRTICASVVDLSGEQIRYLAGLEDREIDVVFGGAPCQGFSMMGKRALDDSRNQLVFHYVRIVSELQPKYCVFENVKGLTLGKHAQFLTELVEALGTAGYKVLLPYKVLNAARFGVPQSRERLFLMAARHDQKMPEYAEPLDFSVTVRDAIADLPDADDFSVLEDSDSVEVTWETESDYALKLRGLAKDVSDFGYKRIFDPNLLTCSLVTEHTEQSKTRFRETTPGKTESISRFLRLNPDGVCNTLRAGTDSARGAHTSPRPIHPIYARVITVREAARLHSYPDWFRLHATKWHGFRQIGNSVPPLLGRAVAASVVRALGIVPTKPKKVLKLGDPALLTMNMGQAAAYFSVSRTVIAQRARKDGKRKDAAENSLQLFAEIDV
ncbi:DNA cytosine methyltransferase [Massilia atriviolacea]|uniref:Cytosine-specific methyltransferase n=1 Tax=Massilia atriviolacea TaxID=2495579 RepID=A0A430HH84_9BURK|nr:DNA cytosine methyltransferase [Massilia atriviolacea]RSZ56862.1 DNA cytosine methyltransferase [Massilia atriviolacea]